MKQKIFGTVLAALLAVCLLPAAAMAETLDGTSLTWEITNDSPGECVLTISGNGSMGDNQGSDWPWQTYKLSITKVVIEEDVTSIGKEAFADCTKLESVTIPESVVEIGDHAFALCKNLNSITIPNPNSVTSIGVNAFGGTPWFDKPEENNQYLDDDGFVIVNNILIKYCGTDKKVTIPEGVTQIVGAFSLNENLESITIPSSVTSIGESAFAACRSLNSITIPNNVTSIGVDAFRECSDLESVTIPSGVTSIKEGAFSECTYLKSVTFEENSKLKSIGDTAFQACEELKSVTIPSSVTSIGRLAFSSCTSLETIKCQRTEAPTLDIDFPPFPGCPISTIVIPAGAEQSYEQNGWVRYRDKMKDGYSAGVATIGGGKATISTDFAAEGETVTLTATPDAGCYFVEWRSNDVVVSDNSFTMPSRDVAVTAVFAEYSSDPFFYVLNFETNGGSEIKTFTSEDVVTVSLADYKPTKEGYNFTGWYSDRDLTKKITSIRLNADRTIYAGWEEVKPEPEPTCKRDNTCPAAQFADLDLNAWYHDGIHYCLENGMMNGVENKIFAPNEPTNRAMIATILWRMEEKPVINYAMQFTDVNADTWYGEAVRWAAGEGIINGYEDSTFKPDSNITREELAAVLYRYVEHKKADTANTADLTKFNDSTKVSPWAEDAMRWAVACNIINGDEQNLLNPQGSATRAEVAAMLARLAEGIAE